VSGHGQRRKTLYTVAFYEDRHRSFASLFRTGHGLPEIGGTCNLLAVAVTHSAEVFIGNL
jgi:hypothetical protein